jgi:hypothetical protein
MVASGFWKLLFYGCIAVSEALKPIRYVQLKPIRNVQNTSGFWEN